MSAEIHTSKPEFTTRELEEFEAIRRNVFETQIRPTLAAKASWLAFSEPAPRGVKPSTEPEQAREIARILKLLTVKLGETISEAESSNSNFDARYLRLYETYYGGWEPPHPAAPDFHHLKRDSFDRATKELLTAIQGEIPLFTNYSWHDFSAIYQTMGKNMPPLPKELIYAGLLGQDGGLINGHVRVTLPTRMPLMFVNYTFRLRGNFEGQSGNPVHPESLPKDISIQVISLPALLKKP